MRVFAIADLHLSLSGQKPMDVFGDHWKDHPQRIEKAWRNAVGDEDLVAVPGDISWATRSPEALPDLEWLDSLPGTKVLLKGNHDYWWPKSRAKLDALLPPSLVPVRRDVVRRDPFLFFGARGCDLVPLHGATAEATEKRIARELHDLEASIEQLEQLEQAAGPDRDPVKIALFHYPPFALGERESVFTRKIEEAGARICLYGHLHDPREFELTFQGDHRGVEYRLVSADFLGFTPVTIHRGE